VVHSFLPSGTSFMYCMTPSWLVETSITMQEVFVCVRVILCTRWPGTRNVMKVGNF